MKGRKGYWKTEGHEKIKACKSPWTEFTSNCRTMDAAGVCSFMSANSILQPSSLRVKPLKQHSTTCRQYRLTVSPNRKTTGICSYYGCQHKPMHSYTGLTVRLTQEQGAIWCPCTSSGHCLEIRNQSLPQFLSIGHGVYALINQG